MKKQTISEEFKRMQKLAGIEILTENSRYDNKFTDFNTWIDVCTKDIDKYYSSKMVDLVTIITNEKGNRRPKVTGEISWDELMNEFKAEYKRTGNVYPVVLKYGWIYNSDLGYAVIGGISGTGNNRNVGCYKNGDLSLCWDTFSQVGKWDNNKKEGIGPMTQQDAEKLSNAIYPPGSRKD
jgi:hypothetical protein